MIKIKYITYIKSTKSTKSTKQDKRFSKLKLTICFLFILFIIIGLDSRLTIRTYTISSSKIKSDDINIVLITDLHSCKYGDNQEELINAIKSQNPDLILLGGDIFDKSIPHTNSELLFKGIHNLCPIYYVTGNHEYYTRDIPNIFSILSKYNITILEGRNSIVNIKDSTINICGVSDPAISYYTNANISPLLQLHGLSTTLDDNHFNILLSHRPELIDIYSDYNFDLITCGHTHGGQWRLPGLINGLYSSDQGFFPRYAGGEYKLNNSSVIVSRGLARETTNVPRIFNRPELVVINLKKSTVHNLY